MAEHQQPIVSIGTKLTFSGWPGEVVGFDQEHVIVRLDGRTTVVRIPHHNVEAALQVRKEQSS